MGNERELFQRHEEIYESFTILARQVCEGWHLRWIFSVVEDRPQVLAIVHLPSFGKISAFFAPFAVYAMADKAFLLKHLTAPVNVGRNNGKRSRSGIFLFRASWGGGRYHYGDHDDERDRKWGGFFVHEAILTACCRNSRAGNSGAGGLPDCGVPGSFFPRLLCFVH